MVFEFAVDMLVCIVEEKLFLEIRVFKHKTAVVYGLVYYMFENCVINMGDR